jgi:hypothetical protein
MWVMEGFVSVLKRGSPAKGDMFQSIRFFKEPDVLDFC